MFNYWQSDDGSNEIVSFSVIESGIRAFGSNGYIPVILKPLLIFFIDIPMSHACENIISN
jgi:hypothetical protein